MSFRSTSRVLAVWCMDWPAVAALAAAGLPPTTPAAVTLANRVIACSASARAAGVRRGRRRRESQARCPELHVVTADPARDARHFEDVTAAVDDLVPRAEVLRPGLLVLSVRGAARYFGSEQAAAERLVDAVAAAGAECQVGVADQLATAVFAARAGRIIEPGKDALFLSALSIRQLATEPSLAAPGREDLADLLWRMGIRNIGQFAALSRSDVASRFGADAVPRTVSPRRAHAWAVGAGTSAGTRRGDNCDPPIGRVDAAAFAGRSLASTLTAVSRPPESDVPGWPSTPSPPTAVSWNGFGVAPSRSTEDATADRVRWQLDGWLNKRNPNDRHRPGDADPAAAGGGRSAEALQLPLWGGILGGPAANSPRVGAVQGILGPEAVQVPVLSGGRGPAERITFTPLGDQRCRGPIRASRGQVKFRSRRRPCCSTTRSSCSTPTAVRCE